MEYENDFEEQSQDFFPFFRVCKDGQVERYILTTQVDPGYDPFTGVVTKDIVLLTDPKISCRIFLPKMDATDSDDDSPRCRKALPVLFHCHGGGFCTGSAFGPIIKQFLSNLVSTAQGIAVTIDYRLAPEHPLPIAYDDCWAAFKWLASHVNGNGPEPWLNEYADFSRVVLCGESTGANLAHDVAVRASVEPLEGLNIESMIAIHPYFVGKRAERVIKYLYPSERELEYEPRLNPSVDPRLYRLALDKILICVAEKDSYKDRGYNYYKDIKRRWDGALELLETLGETHCFHLLDATSPNIDPFMAKLTSFIKHAS